VGATPACWRAASTVFSPATLPNLNSRITDINVSVPFLSFPFQLRAKVDYVQRGGRPRLGLDPPVTLPCLIEAPPLSVIYAHLFFTELPVQERGHMLTLAWRTIFDRAKEE